MTYPSLRNSDQVVVSIFIEFPPNSKGGARFLVSRMVFVIIWEMFYGRISLNSVFPLVVASFVWCSCGTDIYISLIANIRSSLTHLHGFQLLVLLPWSIEITFFLLYQQNESYESKVKFRQAGNRCKRILEATKVAYVVKAKESITSLPSPGTFCELLIVLSTKVNLLYILYSKA